jgi:aspartate/tyrosine/aromatic aminotransferase
VQGAYRDDNGQPVVLDCVREAEKRVTGSKFMECAVARCDPAAVAST